MGQILDDYELRAPVGPPRAVRMYDAVDRISGRSYCLRVLVPQRVRAYGAIDRFLARADLGRLVFPGWDDLVALPIYRVGRTPDGAYLVTPHVVADDLETFVTRHGPLAWPLTRRLLFNACRALHRAHRLAIAHGDLRAEHCLVSEWLDARGAPVRDLLVMDFGTALGEPAVLLEPGAPKIATVHDDLHAAGRLALHMLLGELPTDDHVRRFLSEQKDAPDHGAYRTSAARALDLPPAAAAALRRLLTDDLAVAFPDALSALGALAVLDPLDLELQQIAARLRNDASAPAPGREREAVALVILTALAAAAQAWL